MKRYKRQIIKLLQLQPNLFLTKYIPLFSKNEHPRSKLRVSVNCFFKLVFPLSLDRLRLFYCTQPVSVLSRSVIPMKMGIAAAVIPAKAGIHF
jgi:hypothetical protein